MAEELQLLYHMRTRGVCPLKRAQPQCQMPALSGGAGQAELIFRMHETAAVMFRCSSRLVSVRAICAATTYTFANPLDR